MCKIRQEMLVHYPILQDLPIQQAMDVLLECYDQGGKILTCGNGGSAADAEHIVGELMKGFRHKRPLSQSEQSAFWVYGKEGENIAGHLQKGIPAIALNSQTSLLTAVGNDTSFDLVFAQQVYGYGKAGDVLIAMTTSGSSQNVVYAAITAKTLGMRVIGITGKQSGALGSICDVCLAIPAAETYRVQELTLPVYHALCAMLEHEIFGEE